MDTRLNMLAAEAGVDLGPDHFDYKQRYEAAVRLIDSAIPQIRLLGSLRKSLRWCTVHVQKDGRINLGTVVHSDPNCVALRGHESFTITGTAVERMPKCGRCSG